MELTKDVEVLLTFDGYKPVQLRKSAKCQEIEFTPESKCQGLCEVYVRVFHGDSKWYIALCEKHAKDYPNLTKYY